MSKNTNYLVVLSETKESKDKILGSYYPWVLDFWKSQKYLKYQKFGGNRKFSGFV